MQRQALIGSYRFLSSRRQTKRFTSLTAALKVFHEQHGHFLVPYTFQVPQNEVNHSTPNPWPLETRGLNLGRKIRTFVRVSSIDTSSEVKSVRGQLDAVGFPIIRDWKHFYWEEVTLSALKTYRKIEGDLCVPRKFSVPEGDQRWPKATWGLRLGFCVNGLRKNREKLTASQVQDLDNIEFVWVTSDYKWNVLFMPALRRFRQLYGHAKVPQKFEIRADENSKWPKRLIGYQLGKEVNKIRASSIFAKYVKRDRKELEELGFYLYSSDDRWQNDILPAFETYFRVYGNCCINKLFVVPEEKPWPRSVWGMKLGFIAKNIRNRGDFFLQVARDYEKLEEIKFV